MQDKHSENVVNNLCAKIDLDVRIDVFEKAENLGGVVHNSGKCSAGKNKGDNQSQTSQDTSLNKETALQTRKHLPPRKRFRCCNINCKHHQ